MNLTWGESTAPDFLQYELHRGVQKDFTIGGSTKIATIKDAKKTGATASSLDANKTYYFKVRVLDTGGLFADSNEVFAKTLPLNQPPIPDGGPDITTVVNREVTLFGKASDPDGTVTRYRWDFTTDGTWDTDLADSGTGTTVYVLPQTFTATLEATDDDGATATDLVTVVVTTGEGENIPPTANAGADLTVVQGDVVDFVGGGFDTDGVVMLFEWDFDADGSVDSTDTFSGEATNVYDLPGSYRARLIVTDDDGAKGTDTVAVTVLKRNHPPVAVIASPREAAEFEEDDAVLLDAAGSSDEDGDPMTFVWTLGDRTLGRSRSTYALLPKGTSTVKLTVGDGSSNGTAQVTVKVVAPANEQPRVRIDYPRNNDPVSGAIVISGRAFDDEGVAEVSVKIDTGTFQPANGGGSWSYSWNTAKVTAGKHKITVRAEDFSGAQSDEVVITVNVEKPGVPEEKKVFIPGFDSAMVIAAAAVSVALAGTARRRRA